MATTSKKATAKSTSKRSSSGTSKRTAKQTAKRSAGDGGVRPGAPTRPQAAAPEPLNRRTGAHTEMLTADEAPPPPYYDLGGKVGREDVLIDRRLIEARDELAASEAEAHVGRERLSDPRIDRRLIEERDRTAEEEARSAVPITALPERSRRARGR